jgi:hypothetical protein
MCASHNIDPARSEAKQAVLALLADMPGLTTREIYKAVSGIRDLDEAGRLVYDLRVKEGKIMTENKRHWLINGDAHGSAPDESPAPESEPAGEPPGEMPSEQKPEPWELAPEEVEALSQTPKDVPEPKPAARAWVDLDRRLVIEDTDGNRMGLTALDALRLLQFLEGVQDWLEGEGVP